MEKNQKIIVIACGVLACIVIGLAAFAVFTGIKNSNKNAAKDGSEAAETYKRPEEVESPEDALNLLYQGNRRMVSGNILKKEISSERRKELIEKGQHPFAVILSCSDSRVPPEILFDQALGDLFIVRDAGNVADAVTLGSVEYGTEHLKAPLVVVLGHTKCGAVKATVDGGEVSDNIAAIIKKIMPSYEKVKSPIQSKEDTYTKCEDANIANSVSEIKKSAVIKHLIERKEVKVIGAKYHLDSGEVIFTE